MSHVLYAHEVVPKDIPCSVLEEAPSPSTIEHAPAAFAATVVSEAADCIESVPVPLSNPAEPAGKPVTVAPDRSSVPVNEADAVPNDSVDTLAKPSVIGFSVAPIAPLSPAFSRPWYEVLMLFPVNGIFAILLYCVIYQAQTLVSASQLFVLKFQMNGGGVGVPLHASSAIAYHQEPLSGCVKP
jgi:hypothetical protein